MAESSKTALWDRVCKTNTAHTKHVSMRGGFTAIDPYHQIHNATVEFGPAGDRWGWTVKDVKFLPTEHVAVLISLWHPAIMTEEGAGHIEQWGQCSMTTGKQERPDPDCMKKATTDGITKCLSYLGFNADVFLGKFDDNKYVEELKRDEQAAAAVKNAPPVISGAQQIWLDEVVAKMMDAVTSEGLQAVYKDSVTYVGECSRKHPEHPVVVDYKKALAANKARVVNLEAQNE